MPKKKEEVWSIYVQVNFSRLASLRFLMFEEEKMNNMYLDVILDTWVSHLLSFASLYCNSFRLWFFESPTINYDQSITIIPSMDAVPKSVKHLSEEITFAEGNNFFFPIFHLIRWNIFYWLGSTRPLDPFEGLRPREYIFIEEQKTYFLLLEQIGYR